MKNIVKMNFDATRISDFPSSMDYLIESMKSTGRYLSRDNMLEAKPVWLVQTEKFSSLFDRIKEIEEKLDNFKNEYVFPVYNSNNVDLNSQIVDTDNVVQDDFVKIEPKVKTEPEGIFFKLGQFVLPISAAYTAVVCKNRNDGQQNIFPFSILIGAYSVLYHSAKDNGEDDDNLSGLKENISTLVSSIDMFEKTPKRTGGNILENILGNIDLGQIGDVMKSITGDENASEEFSKAFGKVAEEMKSGKDPSQILNDLMKEQVIRTAENADREELEREQQEGEEEMPALEEVE